jgi:hypothetical protein
VDLRAGAHAYLFVFDPPTSGPGRPSSQLRLYEERQGRLGLRLEFQPRPPLGQNVRNAPISGVVFDPGARLPHGLAFAVTGAADVCFYDSGR